MADIASMFKDSSQGYQPGQRTVPDVGQIGGQMEGTVAGPTEADYVRAMKYMTQGKRDMGPEARHALSMQSMFKVPGNAPGMVAPGNIDIAHRPRVQNSDGSVSTVRSMSFNPGSGEVLVPTVSEDARIMPDREAKAQYLGSGRSLGTFDTPEHATAYAKRLHEQQANQTGMRPLDPGPRAHTDDELFGTQTAGRASPLMSLLAMFGGR